MPDIKDGTSYIALFGWSLRAIEAIERFNRKYVVVAPSWAADYAKDNGIPHIPWDFERINDRSGELYETLKQAGVEVAVPLFEETVEWAGAINSRLLNKPKLFNQAMLFRDKAMMKRRAQMMGIPVGVFEVAEDRRDVLRFLRRVNEALLKLEDDPEDPNEPIHLKQFSLAGCAGHRVIRTPEEVDAIGDEEFPCLLESHLAGKEFSCEVFVHKRKIRFCNISQYVHLGYSVFVPAGAYLESWRKRIVEEIERLVEAFDVDYGLLHAEYFVTSDGRMHFGEVAYRVPGGNAFELIERAYGFNAYQAHVLVSDPKASEEEVTAFFPKESEFKGYAGTFLVYPKRQVISQAKVPEEVEQEPYYEHADLSMPVDQKVAHRVAFGNHYGSAYFFGDDADRMEEVLLQQETYDFYV